MKAPTQQINVPEDWTPRLAEAVAGALREFAPTLGGEPVILLAVDCHPWNGTLGLSGLTAAEAEADSLLNDPAEMAAWEHYEFAARLASWQPTAGLGAEMQAAYDAGDRPAVAAAFLSACAAAVRSPSVSAALTSLTQADGFRWSVTHPDSGQEFVGQEFV